MTFGRCEASHPPGDVQHRPPFPQIGGRGSRGRLASPWVLLVILAITTLLSWGNLHRGHNWGDDFASYILQAQSLLNGSVSEFVKLNRFTIQQSDIILGPVAYPWGLPVLLAPILWRWGLNFVMLKALNLVCYLGFLTTIWFGIKKYLSPGWGLLYVMLFAFNVHLISAFDTVLSDIPYLFVSTLAVVLTRHLIVEQHPLSSNLRALGLVLQGLAVAISMTLRANSLLLPVFMLFCQAAENLRRQLPRLRPQSPGLTGWLKASLPCTGGELWLQALPYLALAIFMLAWQSLFPTGSYNLADLQRLKVTTVLYHIYYYFVIPLEFLAPFNQSCFLLVIIAGYTGRGIWQRAAQDYDFLFYCLLTILFYLFVPFLQGLRFIYPILPFVVYFFMQGVQTSAAVLQERWRAVYYRVLAAGLGLLVAMFAFVLAIGAIENQRQGWPVTDGPQAPLAQEAFAYLAAHTQSEDVVIFFKPRALRLFTHRLSAAISNPDRLNLGDYLLMASGVEDNSQITTKTAAALQKQGRLALVFQNPAFQLYKINP